jgi:ubiquinone biosynthesis monooxygenase Coq6
MHVGFIFHVSFMSCHFCLAQVWDGLSDARIVFAASELCLGIPESYSMALLTENYNLQRALLQQLREFQEVQILDKVKVDSIRRDDRESSGWPMIHLSDGRAFRTRLLVSPP